MEAMTSSRQSLDLDPKACSLRVYGVLSSVCMARDSRAPQSLLTGIPELEGQGFGVGVRRWLQ